MKLSYGADSIRGLNHQRNEDRVKLLGNEAPLIARSGCGQIFAVFDGIGSAPRGGAAAQEMCDRLVDFFKEGNVHIFHAGDTLGLLLKDDETISLTSAHAKGNMLLRYFGMGPSLAVESVKYPVEERDLLILVSDGVTKVMNPDELADIVRRWSQDSPKRAVRELCGLAERLFSPDDITAVVVEVEELEEE
jgi:serine/threonine protein phosphatase PrpC